MARSKLLKDIVTGNEDIENILLRLKVVLSDLQNDSIISWVNGEMGGYENTENLPSYRILVGKPIGTFLVNYTAKYTNAQVPLEHLIPQDMIEKICTIHITDSIGTLNKVLDGSKDTKYAKMVSTSFCHSISRDDLQLVGMQIEVPPNIVNGITSKVKSKLVDVVMELEKQYENLDELDIADQVKENPSKAEQTIYNIEKIIFDDSIKIGDKNKIKKSLLGHIFGGERD